MRFARIPAVAAILFALSVSDAARADGSITLVEAFQRLCVDTQAHETDMEKALLVHGAREHGPKAAADWPMRMTTHSYELAIDSNEATVSIGTIQKAARIGYPGVDDEVCIIVTRRKDDAAIAAIRAWVGVPPDTISDRLTDYRFVTTKNGHAPAPTNAADEEAAEREGRDWSLTIFRPPGGESLQYARHHGSPGPI